MESPLKTPEQLLAYKTLDKVLAGKRSGVFSVGPNDTVYAALFLMAEKGTGFVVVQEHDRLVGVFSERDYARRVILENRASRDTTVRDVMTQKVITVSLANTVPQCVALMNQNNIRHLPVVDGSKVIGVLSVRDILKEIVEHHERVIRDLERDRMTILNPGSSY